MYNFDETAVKCLPPAQQAKLFDAVKSTNPSSAFRSAQALKHDALLQLDPVPRNPPYGSTFPPTLELHERMDPYPSLLAPFPGHYASWTTKTTAARDNRRRKGGHFRSLPRASPFPANEQPAWIAIGSHLPAFSSSVPATLSSRRSFSVFPFFFPPYVIGEALEAKGTTNVELKPRSVGKGEYPYIRCLCVRPRGLSSWSSSTMEAEDRK